MRTMKSSMRLYGLFCAALLPVMMCLSCNKLISDLIPPDEQKLISLDLRNVERFVCSTNTAIRDHSVTVTVPKGTDVTRLLPEAVVSPQATLFPVTLRYLQEAFPATDVLKIGSAIGSFENIEAINKWFFEMYAENPNFNIPPLVFPINFLSPVPFAVIGGQGRIELYTVKVLYDDGTDPATGTLPEGVPAEKNILSFSVGEPPQIGESAIGVNTVDFAVKAGTEVRALTVQATVSPHAILIPLTEPYLVPLLRSLGMDPLSVLSGYITAPNKEMYLRALFAPVNLSSVIVPLNKPIDFTNPVQFAVLGRDKDVKLYTARCKQTVTGAVLKNFGFSKVKNPGLVKDGTVRIDRAAKTVTAELFYPVEYADAWDSFLLYYDIAYAGDSAEIAYRGIEYEPTEQIRFRKRHLIPSGAQYHLGTAETKIIITFGTEKTEYRLFISFKEDPDTVRSITDFRFTKDKNSELKTLSMAAIANDGHEGTITTTVLYTGSAKPESLIPTFITPGTVTVNGAAQTSGSSAQDFRKTLTYICTSRDGQYTRKYTVKIRFVYAEPSQTLLKTFRFPAGVNPLTKDSEGRIDQTAHTVHISAHYAGERPKKLIPEFSATGEVTVDALTQSSGFSVQDFEYPVYYKVTDPDDPQTYTIYAVTVHFEYSADSGCELTEFKLLTQDNPSLTQDVTAFISAHSGVIYALLPRGADAANLIPRFTARGRVTVDGVEQTSGETAADFSEPVEYKVTSENGLHTKTYRVTLQQAGGIIYVDPKATGRGNGSTWEDAFTNLEAALQKANEMPAEVSAEIWLSKDCTLNNKQYELKRTLTLRGGFDGIEYEADQRNKDNKSVFDTVNFSSSTPIRGTLTFDGIEFTDGTVVNGIQWDSHDTEKNFALINCALHGAAADIKPSASLDSVTVKNVLIDPPSPSERCTVFKLNCREALIEQCVITKEGKSIGWASSEWLCRIFDVNSGAEAAQSVTIKDIAFPSHWANTFTAKTLIAERITADTVWECIGCKKLRVVQCTNTPVNDFSIHAPSEESTRCGLRFIDCTGGSIEIENSKLRYLTGRRRDLTGPLQRVKSLRIKDSYIMHCSSYPIIVESLTWDNSGMPRDGSGDMAISGYELKMPACSVTLRNLFFFSSIYSGSNYGYGSIDTMCRTWLCKAVMESVPVHTDIDGVIAGRIECGYQEDSAHLALNTSYTLQGQPLTLPPYHSQYLPNEPIEFKSPGTQTVQNFLTGYLCVLSGDRIDVTGGYSKYNTQHSVEASGGITAYLGHWWEDTDFDYNNKKAHPVCYIRNEKVENSTVTLRKMKMYRSWIRAVTNNLTVEGIYPFEGIGAMVAEFFGYDTVTVKNCLFKPCRGLSYSQNGSVKFSPGFIAVGKNRQIDSSVRFDSAHTVLTGTVVDTLRNGNQHSDTYPCTVAVKQ